jgi:hypothetical protein
VFDLGFTVLQRTGNTIKIVEYYPILSISVLGSEQMRATLEKLKYKRIDLLAMKIKTLTQEKIQEILEDMKTIEVSVFC